MNSAVRTAIAGVAIVLLAVSCGRQKNQKKDYNTVKIDTVEAAESSMLLHFPGKVVASEEVGLSFKVSGTIAKIYVDEGSKVRTGQLLALMDTTDYRIQLDATQAEYDQVKADAQRVISLYDQKVTTKQNYDKAVYGLKQIEAKYNNHKNQLAYCRLYAPVAGTIQAKNFEQGENVSAGMPVLTMVGGGAPEVVINIPAADYIRRAEFESYDCSFDIFPSVKYDLKLLSVSPKANANQLYNLRFQVQKGEGQMPSPGMNTNVNIHCSKNGVSSFKVPAGGIFVENDTEYVFVLRDCVLEKRQVATERLLSDGDAIVTSDMLEVGDTVAASGTHYVKEGEKVRPLEEASKTNIGGLL